MTTAVLLAFSDGTKEFVRDAHVHGFRDGMLLIAAGAAGAGPHAVVLRAVPVARLAFAETCLQDDEEGDGAQEGSGWSMAWPDV